MMRNILCIILCMILLSACSSKSNEIIEGYSNCEEYYSDGFQDYIDYCKYFYKESEDKKIWGEQLLFYCNKRKYRWYKELFW